MLPGAAPIRVALAVTLPQEHLRQAGRARGGGGEGEAAAANTHFLPTDNSPLLHPVGHPLSWLERRPRRVVWALWAASGVASIPQLQNVPLADSLTRSVSCHCAGMHARCSVVRPQLLRPSPLRRLIKRKRFCRLPTQISPRYRLAYNTTVLLCDPRMWFLISRFSHAPVLGIFFSAQVLAQALYASSSFLASSCLPLK